MSLMDFDANELAAFLAGSPCNTNPVSNGLLLLVDAATQGNGATLDGNQADAQPASRSADRMLNDVTTVRFRDHVVSDDANRYRREYRNESPKTIRNATVGSRSTFSEMNSDGAGSGNTPTHLITT